MSLSSASAKLHFALKNLRLRWEETRAHWGDVVRHDFEENRLNPIESEVSATLAGMNNLDQVLRKAQQECE